jgi:hypothetical protein
MKNTIYDFDQNGIRAMYSDSVEMVMSALCGENPDFTIDQLDINITIGDKTIILPTFAEVFEMLFTCLEDIEKETK